MPETDPAPTNITEHLAPRLVEAAHEAEAFSKLWKRLGREGKVALGHVCREAFGFATAVALQATAP
ncbi:MAG TPA: hypothetical protein VLE43_11130, partial [Candidatus Saccharimonadia bacterium]|nr:hypothetical protein [Candidatus Saccharimonadia bacterium]